MQYETSGVLPLGAAPIRIDKSRYEQVKTAKSSCLFALEIEEKFALLLDNYYEFECELLRLAEASLIWPHRDHQHSMQERLTLDRRLVNLLTACRLYLDQTDHGLSSLFGHSSRERDNVTRFKHELYEKHWGYRFMEALAITCNIPDFPFALSNTVGLLFPERSLNVPKWRSSRRQSLRHLQRTRSSRKRCLTS